MNSKKIIGAFALIMAAVMVFAVPVADVSASTDDGVTIAVDNTDAGMTITFTAGYEERKTIESICDISGISGSAVLAKGMGLGDIPASIAQYFADPILGDDGKKVSNFTIPSDKEKEVMDNNTTTYKEDKTVDSQKVFDAVEYKTVTATYVIAGITALDADGIKAIQDEVKAQFEGFISQADVDKAVEDAISAYVAANPVPEDKSVIAWCVAVICAIAAAGLGLLVLLGFRACKKTGRAFL